MMAKHSPPPEPPRSEDFLDKLARINLHFGRFARDVLGIFFLLVALLSLLALWGLTEGTILSPWVGFLRLWLGWGSYLFVLSLGAAGFLTMRRGERVLHWGRLLWLETAAFLTLALFAFLGGNLLSRAEQGLDGGRLGWGLWKLFTILFPYPWGIVVLIGGWGFAVMSGFGLWRGLETLLRRAAGEVEPEEEPDSVVSAESEPEHVPARKKPARKLPPEFRKSLAPPPKESERPAKPPPRDSSLPPLSLLPSGSAARVDERTINQTAGLIEKTLSEFGIPARVIGYRVGPSVTQFAVEPGFIEKAPNGDDAQRLKVRVAQIASLQKDLALALSAQRLRIEAPVPGRSYVGIEVPNAQVSVVRLRPILESEAFYRVKSPLAIALGRDVSGKSVVADLAAMPHLLIAGATGSGKSVCITSIAVCLAMNNSPENLRMVMIDSKMVELIRFNGLPHLYGKVETDITRIQGVLRWVVQEMEQRYKLLEHSRSRNIDTYNRKILRTKEGRPLPKIVVLIDEMADLMMHAPDATEYNLVRLAQMARATGIHLVMATQRPSTDVVTGLIKANFPARIAFAVASGVDSRVILDTSGAENLLGRGDMLFLAPDASAPLRVQGVMMTDREIEKVIAYWRKAVPPSSAAPPWERLLFEADKDEDEKHIEDALALIRKSRRASASYLQRQLRIGYPRAARLLDTLEEMGAVGPSRGGGRDRDVLLPPEDESEE